MVSPRKRFCEWYPHMHLVPICFHPQYKELPMDLWQTTLSAALVVVGAVVVVGVVVVVPQQMTIG